MRYLRLILPLLLLVFLPTLFLWKLTLAGRILVGLDPFNFFYPYHDGVAAALAAGHLAEWNAMLFGGVPFLADSQAQLFYPFGWPFLAVSAPKALIYGIALHLGIAALGTYCWARWGLGMSAWGAWLAGALFALSGYLGAQIEHVNQVQAAAWLPWLLLGYQWGRGLPENGYKHEDEASENKDKITLDYKLRTMGLLLGSFALAMSLLAGHAQTTFISLLMLGLWMLRCAIRDDERTRTDVLTVQRSGISRTVVVAAWRNFLNVNLQPLVAIVLIGALLSAIQLVPTQRLSSLSQRAGGLPFLEAVSFSFDPRIMPRAMLPTFGQDVHLLSEYVAWVGFIGLTLALIGALAPYLTLLAQESPSPRVTKPPSPPLRKGERAKGRKGERAKRQRLSPPRPLAPSPTRKTSPTRPLAPSPTRKTSPPRPLASATRSSRDFGLLASGTGLFLALGGYNPLYWLLWAVVPGFDLFRAPARWLLLWALGVAILAGVGLEQLRRREQGLGERGREQGLGEILALPSALKFILILALLLLLFFVFFGSWPQPPLSVLPWWIGAVTLAMIAVGSRWIWPKSFAIPHSAFVIALMLLELWAAAWGLDYQQATAPEAYGGLRPVPAHLITKQPEIGAARVLSLSDLTWDPGDLGNLQARHAELLGEKPIYDLVVSTKLKEVLGPNQPMRWNLQSADGYGGGLLPSLRWVEFQKSLPLAEVVPDGRLREQLTGIPRPALLDVMAVEWIVADKVLDWWSQNIYHDLGAPVTLAAGDTIGGWSILADDKRASGRGGETSASSVEPGAIGRDAVSKYGLSQVTALSLMVIGDWPGQGAGYLSLGEQTVDLSQAEEVATRETPRGIERHLLLTLELAVDLNTVEEIAITAEKDWRLGALSLVDSSLPSFQPLPANPKLRMTFSGDVKVYERTNPPGRAYIVPQAIPVETTAAAASFVAEATFNAQDTVIIEQENANKPLPSGGTGSVTWLRDEPGDMQLEVSVPEGGWLVVADAPFPGWQATVDGGLVEWHAANVINRALFLAPGEHTVSWRYQTPGLQMGIIGTLLGVLALMCWLWYARQQYSHNPSNQHRPFTAVRA